MNIETDIEIWLKRSSSRTVKILTTKFSNRSKSYIANFPSRIKYNTLARSLALGSGLGANLPFDIEPHVTDQFEYSRILKLESQHILYYRFTNDDKYFLVNEAEVGYQESDLYNSFYRLLPSIAFTRCIQAHHENAVWIFPRSQYGHFIYDEVLPQLVSFYEHFGCPPSYISMICSCKWQEQVVRDLCRLLFDTYPTVNCLEAPSFNTRIMINGGYHALSRYPLIIERAKALLQKRLGGHSTSSINKRVFLSRQGFDASDTDRIANRADLLRLLGDLDFIIIKPHHLTLIELHGLLRDVNIILSEPGTTPLLGYICGNKSSRFVTMASSRCITDCPPKYAYSGWRYHLPWLDRTSFAWGSTVKQSENPFSDCCTFSIEILQLLLDKHDF